MTLRFCKYNNYYDRIVKKFNTVSGYNLFKIKDMTDIDFNPNDGVSTEVMVEYFDMVPANDPDYLVVWYTRTVEGTTEDVIDSRWFIMDMTRTRGNQWKVSLRRDVVVDYLSDIINAPCFIEKATLKSTDPFIFNKENMTYNQIKTSETLLKDVTGIPWIVGYMAANAPDKLISHQPFNAYDYNEYFSLWKFAQYQTTPFKPRGEVDVSLCLKDHYNTPEHNAKVHLVPDNVSIEYTNNGVFTTVPITNRDILNPDKNYVGTPEFLSYIQSRLTKSAVDGAVNSVIEIESEEDTEQVLNLKGKIARDRDTGKLYKIVVESIPYATTNRGYVPTSSEYYTQLRNACNSGLAIDEWEVDEDYDEAFLVTNSTTVAYFIKFELLQDTYTYQVNVTGGRILSDAPYKMFCMPYADASITIGGTGSGVTLSSTKEACSVIASTMIQEYAENIYDVQILPYCPVVKYGDSEHYYYITSEAAAEGIDYNLIKYEELGLDSPDVGVIMWASTSQFSFTINLSIDVKNVKIESECDMHRLCSPNYASAFEFNAAKNGGVNFFTVDCAYKPFTPYIHIAPNFKLLYGGDYNDARGLICNGDFSFPQTVDKWSEYQLNNKNYQNMFDREIQNMEFMNKYQMRDAKVNAIVGTLQGGVSGAGAGAMAGGPWGAAAGAILGTIGAGVGGSIDVSTLKKTQAETLDYKRDMFGMQLQNIQALPNTITKVSALNPNNKLFPVLEYYTCTDEEKKALRNKLYYNGMTVGRIGTIREFRQPLLSYIKGHIIRFTEGLAGLDTHMANTIAEEIYKGVFI